MLFTSKEYDRIRFSINQTKPQRVVVAVNSRLTGINPNQVKSIERRFVEILEETDFLADKEAADIRRQIEKRFVEMRRDEPAQLSWDGAASSWRSVDFYDFEKALGGIYELILRELLLHRHEVIVNLNGGTRPVAIAAFIATSLATSFVEEGLCQSMYYHAQTWRTDQSGSSFGKGVVTDIDPYQRAVFDMSDMIPSNEDERRILVELLGGTPLGRGGLTRSLEPASGQTEMARRARVNRRIDAMKRAGLVEVRERKVALTRRGMTIARLVQIEQEILASTSPPGIQRS